MRNLRAVDLNLLVVFDALFDERNVTRAGERLGLSQPALSKGLNRLRHLFEDQLFVRRDGAMQPTARALELAPGIRRALVEVSAIVRDDSPAAFDPAKAVGVLTIASGDLFDCVLAPPFMARLRREARGVSIRIQQSNRLSFADLLTSGSADLAIMMAPDAITDLRRETLYVEDLVTLVAPDNPFVPADAATVSLEAFLACAHVIVSPEGRGSSPTDAWLAARGLSRTIALTLPTFAAAPLVIAQNPDLLIVLPRRFAATLGGPRGVRLLPPPFGLDAMPVHAAWHSRRDADPLHRWVRETLKAVATAL